MLFLKSTSVTKAPGIYEVDIAAKPPGKTFGVYMATDPDNPPTSVLEALAAGGFKQVHSSGYTHKDRGKVLDLHFQKMAPTCSTAGRRKKPKPTWRSSTRSSAISGWRSPHA